ncbi:MAG: translation initiation factor IF-3 [Candidatus Berkelbacteria bacterium]|nr:translation initiation factor IF-3 [Candidatus Berkelbacteria bacterium]
MGAEISYTNRASDKIRYRVNEGIRRPEVFLIDEEGNSVGKIQTSEALRMARERNYDLVEIGPNASPPVCKLLDFGKFKYELEKKMQKNHANKAGEIKEIRLGLKTDEHDFNTKIEQSKKFIEKGYKIKLTVKMIGRENIYASRALGQIERFKNILGLTFESTPMRFGTRFNALLIKSKEKEVQKEGTNAKT